MEQAKLFFEKFIGSPAQSFQEIPQSGSGRRNYTAEHQDQKWVVTYNQNIRENESFFYFTKIFNKLKLATPSVLAISEDRQFYVQDFLGKQTLSQLLEKERLGSRTQHLIQKCIGQLYLLQSKTKNKIDYYQTFEYQTYNQLPILHDLYYFKFMFLDVLEVHYHRSSLLLEFQKLADRIAEISPRGLMLRDFQARNILVDEDDTVSFIDYQSAMEGPLSYDLVSFLYQAKANLPEIFRQEMIQYYISLFSDKNQKQGIEKSILPIRFIRNLQVLGAYGFRGLVQKKEHFINSIPSGIQNLTEVANTWQEIANYPILQQIIQDISTIHIKK